MRAKRVPNLSLSLSVRLPAEYVPNAHRRYISHYWRNAQEQCGVLKSLLLTMLPTCKIYVDDDDMEDEEEEIEGQLDQTTAVLVFLTSEYVGSRKCMHELTTAWRLLRPIPCTAGSRPRPSSRRLRCTWPAISRAPSTLA